MTTNSLDKTFYAKVLEEYNSSVFRGEYFRICRRSCTFSVAWCADFEAIRKQANLFLIAKNIPLFFVPNARGVNFDFLFACPPCSFDKPNEYADAHENIRIQFLNWAIENF